ncbi:MAG: hypothetical protein N2486_06175 [Caloramator sp.]|nr:hypothetical protein [Caloramator sp.]
MPPKINKTFLYGVAFGVLGHWTLNKYGKNLRPLAVKLTENALLLGEETSKFFSDVKEEVVQNRNQKIRKIHEDISLDNCAATKEISFEDDIEELEKKLKALESKIKKIKENKA